ncbi:MAG: hypothetical protein V4704_05515 [Pseudomonadota bacterium]
MPSRQSRQARAAATLLTATGTASASVIAARMLAFSNPATAMSPWHLAEAQRMSSEKLDAGNAGLLAASSEMAMLPARMLQLAARPSAFTPTGWMNFWMEGAGLLLGIGNAALAPAKSTAVRNQARLAKRSRR